MASNKPVIHGRDHLPGGADPIPISYQPIFGQRYIIGTLSDTETYHTFEQTGSPGGIDGTGIDAVSFDSWQTNDDGSTFWNTADALDGEAASNTVYLRRRGFYGVFNFTHWKAVSIPTTLVCGMAGGIGAGAYYLNRHVDGSSRDWLGFAKTNVTDQPAGGLDFPVRFEQWAIVHELGQYAQAVLRIDVEPGGGDTPTNDFRYSQMAIVYLGVIGTYPGDYPQ